MNKPVTGLLCLAIFVASGCGDPPPLGQVRGRVIQAGKPLAGVMVSFLPDPARGSHGHVVSAITDGEGAYDLAAAQAPPDSGGAVVGWHRVVVKDIAQENSRQSAQPAPSRIPERFTAAARTPLAHQIRPGPQVIDLEIPTH